MGSLCCGGSQEGDKFLIKYQIFIKGVWVIVIYSLEDTANSGHRIVEDGYKIVEQGDVRLPRRPKILSLIVSLDDAAEIAPDKKLFSYNDLARQSSVQHKARLVSTEAGKHLLQLVIASGDNICHEAPFDAFLTNEDLYQRKMQEDNEKGAESSKVEQLASLFTLNSASSNDSGQDQRKQTNVHNWNTEAEEDLHA
uniref:uncharacterized protein LOC120327850 n=1 Tax=Styela clava TaxID=7725 RepID=UPI001939F00A|nr:uncharacterized protein LOC120327850 [Styela clava]